MKQRPGDQPLPVVNDSPDVQSMVIEDIRARREVGIERYGTALQVGNGRDSLRDLYEELLDATCYVRQVIAEKVDPIEVTETALTAVGSAIRGDWSKDGRSVRDLLDDVIELLHGRKTLAEFFDENDVCPGGHWREYCTDDCGELDAR